MSTLPTTPQTRATAITRAYASARPVSETDRRHRAIDKKFARRERIIKLLNAVDKMSMRLAQSEFNNGIWAGLGDQEKSRQHWRAARRQRKAFWRLLDALEAETAR